MSSSYTSVPQEEGSGQRQTRLTIWDRTKNWWRSKMGEAESAPLLNRRRMTIEPPQSRPAKIFLSVMILLGVFIALGAGLTYWIDWGDSNSGGKRQISPQEQMVLDLATSSNIREHLKVYTSEAHLAGTKGDKRTVEYTHKKFIEYGITNTTTNTYYPLLNYPISRRLAITSGPKEFQYEASLQEDPVDEDETSHDPDVVPTFHGYSKNGTARGKIVYANYGRVEDFQFLKDQGINLNGTIALMRYGGAFRGLKVRAAEVFGCVGALVYSDPIDDGPLNKEGYPFMQPAKAYPEGPWRSDSSVQRGSVQYLSYGAGDPLTPGYPASKDAVRINPEDSPALAKIPSLPLSYRDALPILKATQGHGVRGNKNWSGGSEEVDYYSGPTEGEAYLENIVDNRITPIWDVIGVIEGSEQPDRMIVMGNHRDAWVYGAVDPSSGSATMLELARVFGELLKAGWRPARTIVFASWDAEEYGLVGSTEWVEDHKELLDREGVVYINVDSAVSGPNFEAGATPSLNQLLFDITSIVRDPQTNDSVYDSWSNFHNRTSGPSARPPISTLGSGSDFVPFLDHLGIASLQISFKGDYGVYHSNYDSFHWMSKFGDPEFRYHEALCKIWGLLALRLADSPILPIHPADYASALTNYVEHISVVNGGQDRFPTLSKAVSQFSTIATKFEENLRALEKKLLSYHHLHEVPDKFAKEIAKVNDQLAFFERGLLDSEGIQGRTWFKHVVYAPGLWTGYSSQVFPAIADALDAGDTKLAGYKENRAAESVRQSANYLA